MITTQFSHAAYSSTRIQSSVAGILRSTTLCSVAIAKQGNNPHIHTAYFCWNRSMDVFFLSDPKTVHGRHLGRLRSAAMTIFDTRQPWDAYHRGMQLFGTCSLATGAQVAVAKRHYGRRFPAFTDWFSKLSPAERTSFGSRFYVFRPARVKVLDEKEFGQETFVSAGIQRK